MKKYDDFLKEQLENEEFKKVYDEMQSEFEEIRENIEETESHNTNKKYNDNIYYY